MKAPQPVAQVNKSLDLLVRNELPPAQLLEEAREIDFNRLASWLDDGMTLDERKIFGFEAALSSRTRRLLCSFRDHQAVAPAELKPIETRSHAWWLLLLVPLLALSAWFLHRPASEDNTPIDHRLYREAEELGFRALSLQELLTPPPPLFESKARPVVSVDAIWPQGHVLARKRLRFEWLPAQTEAQVTVRHISGTVVCQLQGTSPLTLPRRYDTNFEDGETYIWELTPTDSTTAAVPRSFTLAGDAERQHFEEFRSRARGSALSELLVAHYALRLDHLRVATEAARRWNDKHPASELGLATLWQSLRRQENPEALSIHEELRARNRALQSDRGTDASKTAPKTVTPSADR